MVPSCTSDFAMAPATNSLLMFLLPFSTCRSKEWADDSILRSDRVRPQRTLVGVFSLLESASSLLDPDIHHPAKVVSYLVADGHLQIAVIGAVEAAATLRAVEVSAGFATVFRYGALADPHLATANCRGQQSAFCRPVQSSSPLPALE